MVEGLTSVAVKQSSVRDVIMIKPSRDDDHPIARVRSRNSANTFTVLEIFSAASEAEVAVVTRHDEDRRRVKAARCTA